MLEVFSLAYAYNHKCLFREVTFSLPPGKLLHLQGANGTGKTTLLKLIAGILTPAAGEIRRQGQNIAQNLTSYHQAISYVGHKAGLNLQLTLQENFALDVQNSVDQITFFETARRLQLERLINTPCYQLSAGQQKRASLLRLAMKKASLWLLDEPLVSLDQEVIEILINYLKNHLKNNGSIILSSHQPLPKDLADFEYHLT